MCQISVIQIFIQFCHSLIYSFSKKIDFSGNTGRLGHADLACSCSGKSRSVDNWFVNKLQVRNMNFGTDDTHLYKKKAFGIGMTADSSFQIHAQYLNGVSKGKILRLQLFFRFLYGGVYGHALFGFVHAVSKILAFFFNGSSVHVIFLEFVEHFHGLICVFLSICKNLTGFFVGFAQDPLFTFVQLLLLGL